MVLEQAKQFGDAGNVEKAVALLDAHKELSSAIKAYEELMQHMYWQKKNLQAANTVGLAGLARIKQEMGRKASSVQEAMKQHAKVLTYNIASFSWPGWDEPGIAIGNDEVRVGREAALEHYELVKGMNPDAITLARAAWIAGALLLSSRDYATARARFAEAADLAGRGDNQAMQLHGEGFAVLAEILEKKAESPKIRAKLEAIKRRLQPLKDGKGYIAQIETAETVCRRGIVPSPVH